MVILLAGVLLVEVVPVRVLLVVPVVTLLAGVLLAGVLLVDSPGVLSVLLMTPSVVALKGMSNVPAL